MTDDEARKVAQHCIDTWPNGPKAYIWREVVIELDYGAAVGAYRALVREAEKSPTPARFLAHYSNLRQPVSRPAPHADPNGISLDEYLERLAKRAGAGDTNAENELERWDRWLTPKERA